MYKVLIVDDNADCTSYLQNLLELESYTVGRVHGGWEALDVIEYFQPDVVLLDIFLPDMVGYAILERLLQNSKLPVPSVVIITASSIPNEQEAIAAGADAFIRKPLDSNQVSKVVGNLCTQKPRLKTTARGTVMGLGV